MQHPGFSLCYNRIPCHYVLHPERKIVHGAIHSHPLFPSALPAGIQIADTSPSDVPAAYSGAKGSLPFAFILALIARPVRSLSICHPSRMFPNPAQPCVNDYFTLLLRRLKAPDADLDDISLQRKNNMLFLK
ncbi:hypothetical protein [Serratia nevei]|uniref:hypothetical protein n=1 Tax=Serratia nevei TaxID=2703794 RepID=UPI0018D75D68|nr:hypothetical protein [Serratia marcescens]